MTTWIALLRAINVGSGRKVPMKPLARVFEDADCADVVTYIQSGNVVFTHPARSATTLGADLEARIRDLAGFDVPVMLRTAREWEKLVEENPFPKAEPGHLHVFFLAAAPAASTVSALDLAAFAPEELVVVGREAYCHVPLGLGRAKLPAAAIPKLKVPATARNWRTVLKLLDLARRSA
jgi:uncharacterized protein (DUF1697 family)